MAKLAPNLNTAAAAKFLCVTPYTLKVWRRQGTGPPFAKVNRRVLYPTDALGTWLTERTITPAEVAD